MSRKSVVARLAEAHGLVLVRQEALTIRRRRCGKGFAFVLECGRPVREAAILGRLKSLAVPPAYANVRFAADPHAHLQAVGDDAAGRRQYRYHPDWSLVREALKARRLAGLALALPKVGRAVARYLRSDELDRCYAAACVVELVRLTAIRAGGEAYAREHGTRGAATLLKSNVRLETGDRVTLTFKAKGGKPVTKTVRSARLRAAVARLLELPGRRLFQYRGADGEVRRMRASEVNAFLREVSGRRISLKDFRTLVASAAALRALAGTAPATSERQRRRQVREVVIEIAEDLANTPTVCRTSYVHNAVVSAFEAGALKRLQHVRSAAGQASVLARLVARQGS